MMTAFVVILIVGIVGTGAGLIAMSQSRRYHYDDYIKRKRKDRR